MQSLAWGQIQNIFLKSFKLFLKPRQVTFHKHWLHSESITLSLDFFWRGCLCYSVLWNPGVCHWLPNFFSIKKRGKLRFFSSLFLFCLWDLTGSVARDSVHLPSTTKSTLVHMLVLLLHFIIAVTDDIELHLKGTVHPKIFYTQIFSPSSCPKSV